MEQIEDTRVLVYLMTGFLESGKTQFLNFTLKQDYFQIDEPTLLILCEEGLEEYDKKLLKKTDTHIEMIESQDELTAQWLIQMEEKYHPGRVIFECNGMWPISKIEELSLPNGWGIVQKLVTVDASTFQVYLNNMKPLFVEMVRDADLVFFNRCSEDTPLNSFRRNVKVINGKAEIVFENEDGEIDNIFEEEMPYDVDAPVIEIDDVDYGIWFVDMQDHKDRYNRKTIRIKAMIRRAPGLPGGYFVAGRMAETCCADDITFIGYVCKGREDEFQEGQWMDIKAEVRYRYLEAYRRKGPILKIIDMNKVEAIKDVVYFN